MTLLSEIKKDYKKNWLLMCDPEENETFNDWWAVMVDAFKQDKALKKINGKMYLLDYDEIEKGV